MRVTSLVCLPLRLGSLGESVMMATQTDGGSSD